MASDSDLYSNISQMFSKYSVTKNLPNIEHSYISRYKPVAKLGSGTFGKIYWAYDTKSNDNVAIKFMKPNYNDGYGYDVLNEIAYPISLDHPNIVKYTAIIGPGKLSLPDIDDYVENYGYNDSKPWEGRIDDEYIGVVMKLADGNLNEIVHKKLHTIINNLVRLTYQLVDAVLYINNNNIIHRDIKPANILYNNCRKIDDYTEKPSNFSVDDYILTITDFGLAIDSECYNTELSTSVYTLPYRAPEIIITNDVATKYDSKTDVWALGCTFYFMRTGKNIFLPFNKIINLANIRETDYLMFNMISKLGYPKESTSKFYLDYVSWFANIRNKHSNSKRKDICSWSNEFEPGIIKITDPFSIINGQSYDRAFVDLLKKMLIYDPEDRISINDVRKHKFFSIIGGDINNKIKEKPSNNSKNGKCYNSIRSIQTNCISRKNIFERDLHFSYILRYLSFFDVVSDWIISILIQYKSNVKYNIYFIANQLIYRYTEIIRDNEDELKRNLQMYGSNGYLIAANSVDTPRNFTPTANMLSNLSNQTYTTEEIVENQHEMMEMLDFDLLASTPYNKILGYSRIFDILDNGDIIFKLASNILVLLSTNKLYFQMIGEEYIYKQNISETCLTIAHIMVNKSMPTFIKTIDIVLADQIISSIDMKLRKSRYFGLSNDKEPWQNYKKVYEQFRSNTAI